MARLIVKSGSLKEQVLELRMGVNRFGRATSNDFCIEHPTISTTHCEMTVADGALLLHDCNSTNGTFVRGEPIREARLSEGDSFSLGDIEFYIDTLEMNVSIPHFDVPRPAPPVVLTDGSLICPRHPEANVTHQCTKCREVMCDACVTRLRRRGGKLLLLCPLCSQKVEPLGGAKPRKRGLFGLLRKTVKMPFLRSTADKD